MIQHDNQDLHRRNLQWHQRYTDLGRRLRDAGDDRHAAERLRAAMSRVGDEVMAANSGLIGHAVAPFAARSGHAEDLRGAAALALWQAFLEWDPEQGALSTWAFLPIKGAVGREVARLEYDGLDYGAFTARQTVAHTAEHIKAQTGLSATDQQVATQTGLHLDLVRRARQPRALRLDAGTDGSTVDLPDPGAGQRTTTPAPSDADLTDIAADVLSPEQLVVALYSWLTPGEIPAQHNLVIAERLGRGRASVTRARTTGAVLLYASAARRRGREAAPPTIAAALGIDERTVTEVLNTAAP